MNRLACAFYCFETNHLMTRAHWKLMAMGTLCSYQLSCMVVKSHFIAVLVSNCLWQLYLSLHTCEKQKSKKITYVSKKMKLNSFEKLDNIKSLAESHRKPVRGGGSPRDLLYFPFNLTWQLNSSSLKETPAFDLRDAYLVTLSLLESWTLWGGWWREIN